MHRIIEVSRGRDIKTFYWRKLLHKYSFQIIYLPFNRYNFLFRIIFERSKGTKIIHFRYLGLYRKSFLDALTNSFLLILYSLIAKLIGYKIFWTCHNMYSHQCKHKKLEYITRLFFVRFTSSIFVLHENLKDEVKKYYKYEGEVHTICFGDMKDYFPSTQKERNEIRTEYNIPYSAFVILFVGEIQNSKGIKILLKSFFLIPKEKRENLYIILAGPVYDEKSKLHIEKYFKKTKKIILKFGWIHEEMEQLFKIADFCYVGHSIPSVPTMIYLSASYKTPILCLKGGPKEHIVLKYGLGVISEEKTQTLADTLLNLCRKAIDVPENNYKKFFEDNNWELAAKELVDVYKKFTHQ